MKTCVSLMKAIASIKELNIALKHVTEITEFYIFNVVSLLLPLGQG